MAKFEKASVYHSALAKESPIEIMFTGDVRPSRYPGKPPIIPFKVQGEDNDHWYSIENDEIETILAGAPQNAWLNVTFAGSRDAAVVFWGDAPASPPAGPPEPATSPNARPASNGEPLSRTYFEALQTAAAIIDRICADYEKAPTDDAWLSAVHAAAASLYIEHHRNGRTRPIRRETRT